MGGSELPRIASLHATLDNTLQALPRYSIPASQTSFCQGLVTSRSQVGRSPHITSFSLSRYRSVYPNTPEARPPPHCIAGLTSIIPLLVFILRRALLYVLSDVSFSPSSPGCSLSLPICDRNIGVAYFSFVPTTGIDTCTTSRAPRIHATPRLPRASHVSVTALARVCQTTTPHDVPPSRFQSPCPRATLRCS